MTRGIRTLADLKDRCWIDEDTGCWHWRGALSKGMPSLWFAPIGRVTTLSQAIGHMKTGKPLASGLLCYCTCKTPSCANPGHRDVGTRHDQAAVLIEQGRLAKSALVRAAMSRARSTSALSDADVLSIKTSSATCTDDAKKFGVSVSHVSLIRRGKTRHVGVQGSSVFNIGGIR